MAEIFRESEIIFPSRNIFLRPERVISPVYNSIERPSFIIMRCSIEKFLVWRTDGVGPRKGWTEDLWLTFD